jgi:hypothetical protein
MALLLVAKPVEGWCDMPFNKIKDMLGGDSSYKYSYNPQDQTYTQLSGPGVSDDFKFGGLFKKLAGMVKNSGGMKKGGRVKMSSASKRADGIATKGKTRGKIV